MSVLLKLLFIIFVNFTNGEFVSSDNDANLIPNIIGEDSVDQMSSSNESSYLDNLGLDRNETIHISITNPNIIIDENYFNCSILECTIEAFKCVIRTNALESDIKMINTIVECIDEDDIVLEHQEFIESNPYPNRQPPYKRYTSVDRNGGYFTRDRNRQNVSNSDKTNSKKIKNVTNITKNVDSQEEKKQSNFANIFGDSFPFKNGNPFGEGFSYNKNKTQDNLD